MRIGILTSGGDCPGINATIRGVCKTAINHYGMEVIWHSQRFSGAADQGCGVVYRKILIRFAELGRYDARYFAREAL